MGERVKRTGFYADAGEGHRVMVYLYIGEPAGELAVWRYGEKACRLIWTQELGLDEIAIFMAAAEQKSGLIDVYMEEVMLNIAAARAH